MAWVKVLVILIAAVCIETEDVFPKWINAEDVYTIRHVGSKRHMWPPYLKVAGEPVGVQRLGPGECPMFRLTPDSKTRDPSYVISLYPAQDGDQLVFDIEKVQCVGSIRYCRLIMNEKTGHYSQAFMLTEILDYSINEIPLRKVAIKSVRTYNLLGTVGNTVVELNPKPSEYDPDETAWNIYPLYIQARLIWPMVSLLVKHVLQNVCVVLGVACALSRISDYKHHWSDVLSGVILGIIVACLTAFHMVGLFRHPHRMFSDPPYLFPPNIQSSFAGDHFHNPAEYELFREQLVRMGSVKMNNQDHPMIVKPMSV